MKPVTEYTDRELSAEADAVARRISTGKVEGRDAVFVVELAIRLDRLSKVTGDAWTYDKDGSGKWEQQA